MRVESSSDRVVGAGLWVVGAKQGTRLFAAIRVLALARLLAPHDFGLVALALLPLSALRALGRHHQPGVASATRSAPGRCSTTAWTLGLIRRTLEATVLLFGAPAIAAFFESANVPAIIRVMTLLPLLQGARNIGVVEFQQ